ncbi:alpha/beta fold hydrolase [Gordonia hydrophobica]|uniref:Alpha/beta hydrolase n=1 Tax=Gordonia hydrophobica TaxID=40516 RepID=A0ABZ2U615_9ACTN|nr:alpha/beta hydrolase [Gordonia hydrophobica]MBM7367895.1 pimeloyl-ACP methyl ester carboxylesterase [Gordonia hydrophobica]
MASSTAHHFTVSSADLTLHGDHWPAATDAHGLTPALLLHGGGQTRHSWDRTAAALAARGRDVYTLDLRGHGDSSWAPDGDYALDAFVGDLRAVLADRARKPVIIGASLGGITGLCTVGENPDIAAALVMVDVVVNVEQKGIDRIKSFMTDHIGGFADLEEVADAIAAYNPERTRPKNLDGLKKNVRLHDDGRWYWHWDPEFMKSDEGDEPRRHTDPARLAAAARTVTAPTLVVRGGKSDVVSDAGIAHMRELVPHAEIADVSAAGHMVAGDDNEVFAAAIVEFLERHSL